MTVFEIYWSVFALAIILGVALIILDISYHLDSIGYVGIIMIAISIVSMFFAANEGPLDSTKQITPERIIRTSSNVTAVYDVDKWAKSSDMNVFILRDSLICVEKRTRINMFGNEIKDEKLGKCKQ